MRWRSWCWGGALLLSTSLAWAEQPGRCTLLAEVATTNTMVETTPVRVCSVEAFCTDAGWAQVFDAPTIAASRVTVAEPGATAANGHAFVAFGDTGYVTQFGLGVDVSNCRVVIRYGR